MRLREGEVEEGEDHHRQEAEAGAAEEAAPALYIELQARVCEVIMLAQRQSSSEEAEVAVVAGSRPE